LADSEVPLIPALRIADTVVHHLRNTLEKKNELNIMKENSLPKIYQITGLIAFTYSVLLVIYAIYNQFFYVDGTWLHGFTANGFAVLSGLIWIAILFVFKRFLNRVLNYSKSNLLINAYLIFLIISTLSIAIVVYKSVKVYASLEEGDAFNSLTSFATSSISGAIFLFISSFAIILISVPLGNQIRKVDIVQKQLFQILGFTFIGYGVISVLETFGLLGTEVFQFLIKASLSILIGLIIRKVFSMSYSDLNTLTDFENRTKKATLKPKPKPEPRKEHKTPEIATTYKNTAVKEKPKETYLQNEELPKINLEELEDKELILSYFKNLPKEELNRLENIVQNKYNQNLTNEQKQNLVLHYIAEKKL
jgi:hypothetical protein